MRKDNLLAGVTVLVLAATRLFSQSANLDTLSYFSNNNVILSTVWIGAIDSFAIHFVPDSTFRHYDIVEIQFLFSPAAINQPDSTIAGDFRLHEGHRQDGPGDILLSFPIVAKGAGELYPYWKKFDLTSHPEIRSLQGSFWLEGNLLAGCVASQTSLGHSFAHYGEGLPYWFATDLEFAVSVVIKKSEPTNVQSNQFTSKTSNEISTTNFPNPFNAQTSIAFDLAEPSKVTLEIFDLTGRKIRTLLTQQNLTGKQQIIWDGKVHNGAEAASGTYLYKLQLAKKTIMRTIALIR